MMAMESACKLQVGRDRYEGRVRMEGDHIDFAGSTKFRFRLTEIRHPRGEGDAILFNFHGNPVRISLGNVRAAANWMDYILHPQTLADKLGVKEGHVVRVMNVVDDAELMNSLVSKNTKVVTGAPSRCDMVMLGVDRPAELRQLEDLCETLRPNGAIWVLLPKSVRTVTQANVRAAAREAGLNHDEVVDFSETHAAYKVVRPRTNRKRTGSSGNGSPNRRAMSSKSDKIASGGGPAQRNTVKSK